MSDANSEDVDGDLAKLRSVADQNANPTDQTGLEQRLKAARLQRAKILSADEDPSGGAGDHSKDTDRQTGQAISFESKLAAARKARKRALANRKPKDPSDHDVTAHLQSDQASATPTRTEIAWLRNDQSAVQKPEHASASTVTVSKSPVVMWLSVAMGAVTAATLALGVLVLIPAGMSGNSTGAVSDATVGPSADAPTVTGLTPADDGRPIPVIRDLVVVVENGSEGVENQMGDIKYNLRTTPFRITQSTVEYYNDVDAQTATRLAEILGAKIIDLRGIQPRPLAGQVIVHLANDDV